MEEQTEMQRMNAKERYESKLNFSPSFRFIAAGLVLLSLIFLFIGMHKMYAYENPSSTDEYELFSDDEEAVNAYVGGDAYNYIINAGLATANVAIAIFFAVMAFGVFIIGEMREKERKRTYNT